MEVYGGEGEVIKVIIASLGWILIQRCLIKKVVLSVLHCYYIDVKYRERKNTLKRVEYVNS